MYHCIIEADSDNNMKIQAFLESAAAALLVTTVLKDYLFLLNFNQHEILTNTKSKPTLTRENPSKFTPHRG
jgi:hypothetical protein